MSPVNQVRYRLNVVLQMVTALITAILLGQLWLFTITLDAMQNASIPRGVGAAAIACSFLACGSIWILIRFFLRTEQSQMGERQ